MSLLQMGVTMTGADDFPHGPEPSPADDCHIGPELFFGDVAYDPPELLPTFVVARTTTPTPASRSLALVVVTANSLRCDRVKQHIVKRL